MLKWVWSYVKKFKALLLLGFVLTMILAVVSIVNPVITGTIVDTVILGGHHEMLLRLIAIMVGVTFTSSLFTYTYQMIFEHCSQNVMRTMREDLYAHIQNLDFSWYDKTEPGNAMTLLTNDLDAVRHFVAWSLYQLVSNVLIYITAIVVVSIISWKIVLSFLIVTPLIIVLVVKFKTQIKPAHMKVRDQFASLNSYVSENIAGNRVVKAFVREPYEMQRFTKESEKYCTCVVDNAKIRAKFQPTIEAVCGVLPMISILFGGWLVMQGEMTLGQIVTINSLMWTFTQPITMFGTIVDNIQRFSASGDRLYELYRTKPTIKKEKPRETAPAPSNVSAEKGGEGSPEQSAIKGEIEFKNVTFMYNEVPVLKDVCFHVKPCMTVGILGATGSGKSTIAKLMCRYYDVNSGQILVDGKDIRDYDIAFLRCNIGITMQDVFLFSDTVEGNIAFGAPEASFEQVDEAAALARVKEFIGDLTDGYDTVVGERGVGLSGGQKQRIALARLFLADPKVMILDDTTSSVDTETEEKIRQSIKQKSNGHTTFIISHRVSSFQGADIVFVLQDGRVVQSGTPLDLSKQEGYFKTVCQTQYYEF